MISKLLSMLKKKASHNAGISDQEDKTQLFEFTKIVPGMKIGAKY